MKEFSIPVKITLDCCLSVKANNQDEAYEVADDTMYWTDDYMPTRSSVQLVA